LGATPFFFLSIPGRLTTGGAKKRAQTLTTCLTFQIRSPFRELGLQVQFSERDPQTFFSYLTAPNRSPGKERYLR